MKRIFLMGMIMMLCTCFLYADRTKINNTKVVVTREHYMPFAYYDLLKAGYKETDKTPNHIKNAIRAFPPVKPKTGE